MRNQIFLVFDSLRWDVFRKAEAAFLKSMGTWHQAYTQGTYTFPAHMSFFAGKLPQAYVDEDYYDTVPIRFSGGRRKRNVPLWNLSNPESPRKSALNLQGRNIVEGFREQGYATIGSGAMNWFNPDLPAGRYLSEPFEYFKFFVNEFGSSHECADYQIEWALETVASVNAPFFLFLNFGETHHKFQYRGCPWYGQGDPYGNHAECMRRQTACLEYLDVQVRTLFRNLDMEACDIVITSDHGEAMGEDGLWGHGFCHTKVMEVPLLVRRGAAARDSRRPRPGPVAKAPLGEKGEPDGRPRLLAFCWGNEPLAEGFRAFAEDMRARAGAECVVVCDTAQGRMILERHGLTAFSLEELLPLVLGRQLAEISPEDVEELTSIDRQRNRGPLPYGNAGRMARTTLGGDVHAATSRAVLAAYEYLLEKIAPHVVLTWNGALLIQKGLPFVARRAGIPYFYMERGLLPGTFFVDPRGVNYGSSLGLLDRAEFFRTPLDTDLRTRLQAFRRQFVSRGATIVSTGKTMSRRDVRKRLGLSDEEVLLLFPLQIETDTNIIVHSPIYKRMRDIVSGLVRCLDGYENIRVVAKAHPEDPVDRAEDIRAVCGDKVIFSDDINLIPLLDAAQGVITVNSTTGFEMLLRGKPVLCLGNAVYSGKGFTFDLHHERDLPQVVAAFLDAARSGGFAEDAFLAFLHHVLAHSLFMLDRNDVWGGNANIAAAILRGCALLEPAGRP